MGNEISTSTTAATANASNASRKFALPIEILFEILAFVKFYEAPNFFLVNHYLLQICQVYFHSGTVGPHKFRNVRDLTMELKEGLLRISVERNGTLQSVPVPEEDLPKIFNAFGSIKIGKCCRIEAIQFLYKFQSLLTSENNVIICAHNFFLNTANGDESEKQINSNSASSVLINEKLFFLNWIEQKKLSLALISYKLSENVARCLADEPLIARYNGYLSIVLKNERNLCGLEEDAKLIYGWISATETRELQIRHYDAQKAWELACQIALLFEQAHVNKIEAEKMDLWILLSEDTVVPIQMQKICNGKGEQLATLRTFSAKCSDGYETSVYAFYTKSMEYCYENKEELELFKRETIYFE